MSDSLESESVGCRDPEKNRQTIQSTPIRVQIVPFFIIDQSTPHFCKFDPQSKFSGSALKIK